MSSTSSMTDSPHRKPRSLSGLSSMLPSLYNVNTNERLDGENRHFTMAEVLITKLQEATQMTFMPDNSLETQPTSESECNPYIAHVIDVLDPRQCNTQPFDLDDSSDEDEPQATRRLMTSPLSLSTRQPPSPRRPTSSDQQAGARSTLSASVSHSNNGSISSMSRSQLNLRGHRRSVSDISRVTLDSEGDVESTTPPTSILSPPTMSPSSSVAAAEFDQETYQTGSPASVAFGWLRSFNDQSRDDPLRAAMQLLVQPGETPQDLLPSPVMTVNDVAAGRVLKHQRSLRGNSDWAPPRNQILFDVKRRDVAKPDAIRQQGYRCAGCGLRVEINYIKKFRYDHYLGKYFCTSCHQGDKRMIPARIIHRWDFARYRVSVFSAKLLDTIADMPAFNISTHNPKLVKSNSYLSTAARLRYQLKIVAHYLRRCRSGASLVEPIDAIAHMADDEALYSINELVELRSGVLVRNLDQMVKDGIAHVLACPLCMAKGYVCELCNDEQDILFGFQIKRVTKCEECSNVYHRKCFAKYNQCPRCERRKRFKARAQQQQQEQLDEEDEADSLPDRSRSPSSEDRNSKSPFETNQVHPLDTKPASDADASM
eukprot:TRINITY_DN7658_c0_g1_i1.p1 TRINITY_DN7658_c0_g1~~TRINITY_DN7658_c0_g1_i1.p1  ORF type:complete len:598 (+),score=113.63 TRINITY_DN7658_c0_g1_i1:110-1903(+)